MPSPILPDGTLLSLPIRDCGSHVRYRDLVFPDGRVSIPDLVKDLDPYLADKEAHLDPDLRESMIARSGFQAAFGQCSAAQSHLETRGVDRKTARQDADLFLFFGLFREVENNQKWHFVRNAPRQHVIFGWLQVDQIFRLPDDQDRLPPSLARHHPHAIPSCIVKKYKKNTIYVPRQNLTFIDLPGWGLFEREFESAKEDPRRLSKIGQEEPSSWELPPFFRELSNIGNRSNVKNGRCRIQRRGPGQEFVLNVLGGAEENEIGQWLQDLFRNASRPSLNQEQTS